MTDGGLSVFVVEKLTHAADQQQHGLDERPLGPCDGNGICFSGIHAEFLCQHSRWTFLQILVGS